MDRYGGTGMHATTLKKLLVSTAIAASASAWAVPSCGDKTILATLEKMLRDTYFHGDEEERPLELSLVKATARDESVDVTNCSARLSFEATYADKVLRPGVNITGPVQVTIHFDISPDAENPESFIVGMRRIRGMEYDTSGF